MARSGGLSLACNALLHPLHTPPVGCGATVTARYSGEAGTGVRPQAYDAGD